MKHIFGEVKGVDIDCEHLCKAMHLEITCSMKRSVLGSNLSFIGVADSPLRSMATNILFC